MNKKGMSFITIIILFTAFVIGYAVSQQAGFDVDKFKTALNWTDIHINTSEQPEIGNALSYYINGLGAALFEICKWVAQFSVENPTIPWKLLIIFLIFALLAPVLILIFKLIIIIFLLIKEYFQSRKEKREIEQWKNREVD